MWKQATVVPLFKNRGKAEDPTNFRPVSLLPALGKALDKIQTTHLLQYLVERKLNSPHQFGFMPQKPTTLQLLYLTYRWFRALERGKNITAVFLDFQKAFDRVWHPGLLYQLSTLGISEWSVKWLTSYLSERQIFCSRRFYYVGVQDYLLWCPARPASWSCSFIIFINNLPSTVSIPTEIYADDTTLHHEHSKLPSCSTYPALQEAIDCTEEWAETWHGKFGHAKTRILSTNKDIMLEALSPTMEGHAVTLTDNHRHLGVVFIRGPQMVKACTVHFGSSV